MYGTRGSAAVVKEIVCLSYKIAAENLFVVFNSCGSFFSKSHVLILKEIHLVLCHTIVLSVQFIIITITGDPKIKTHIFLHTCSAV